MRKQIWALLNNAKFHSYCLGFSVQKFQKRERNLNIFLAIASSGSIALWAVWDVLPFLWAAIIALSQLINAIKPYIPYFKYIKELNKKTFQMDILSVDLEKLWYEYQNELIDEQLASQRYFDLRKQTVEVNSFSDETVVEITDAIKSKANESMKIYLKNNYDIQIDLN